MAVLFLLVKGSKLVMLVVSVILVFDMLSEVKIDILVGTTSGKEEVYFSQNDDIIHTYIHTYIYAFIVSPQPAYMGSVCFSIQIWPKVTLFVIIIPRYHLASTHSCVLLFSSGNGRPATDRCREKRTLHQPLPASAHGEIQKLRNKCSVKAPSTSFTTKYF